MNAIFTKTDKDIAKVKHNKLWLEIVYGYPSRETFKLAQRGEVILGGCCIEENQPDMACRDCHQGYKKFIPDYMREDVLPDLLAGYRDDA